MSYLKITNDGIEYHHWNSDRKGKARYRKKNGVVEVIDRATKEVLGVFETEEAADSFFYEKQMIGAGDKVLNHLGHEDCFLADDLTLESFLKIIESNPELNSFVDSLYHKDAALQIHKGAKKCDLWLYRSPKVENNVYMCVNFFSYEEKEWSESKPLLKLSDKFVVENSQFNGMATTTRWELLDIIDAVFGVFVRTHEQVVLGVTPVGLEHLFCPCTIKDGLTLGEIFNVVKASEPLQSFIEAYSWCKDIKEFHKEAEKPLVKREGVELTHLQIDSDVELYDTKFSDFTDFYGFGPAEVEVDAETNRYRYDAGGEPERYSVSMTKMPELVPVPVRVGECRIGHFGGGKEAIKVTRQLMLLQILDAIYWDIGFYGGPEQAQELKEELSGMVEGIKDGTLKTIPWKDAFKESDE